MTSRLQEGGARWGGDGRASLRGGAEGQTATFRREDKQEDRQTATPPPPQCRVLCSSVQTGAAGGLGGQPPPLQLPALLQLFHPGRPKASVSCWPRPQEAAGVSPVSAASQEPHDLPGSLVLLLGQEASSDSRDVSEGAAVPRPAWGGAAARLLDFGVVAGGAPGRLFEALVLLVAAVVLLDEHGGPPALLEALLLVVGPELGLDQDGRLGHLLVQSILGGGDTGTRVSSPEQPFTQTGGQTRCRWL